MFERYAHYLSYGATDQQTARSLTGLYRGLLVPGTVAAFQADGTKGFVLTLSAAAGQTRYVIDPRFPLFQQRLERPKKSHEALAELLGNARLVNRVRDPIPGDFSAAVTRGIAENWLSFNRGYTEVSSRHFSKYAARLGELVVPERREGPVSVLVPYMMASGTGDPWWSVSESLWQAHVAEAEGTGQREQLVRVLAATEPAALDTLLAAVSQDQVAVWVDRLDELDATVDGVRRLTEYGASIKRAGARGVRMFALYGGFFAVLLARFGLVGASHGIGYGESRTWRELPQSGPPPARYYLPLAHRYVSLDLALYLWRNARALVDCPCEECSRGGLAGLEYHDLMKHSVRSRHAETVEWTAIPTAEVVRRLREDAAASRALLDGLVMPANLRKQASVAFSHLEPWAGVLSRLEAL